MAGKKTDEKKTAALRNRTGGFLSSIGKIFKGGSGDDSSLDEKISFDISFDLGDIPPIVSDEETAGDQSEETTPFEKSLKKILSTVHAEKAKKEFVDFIRQNEVDRLTPFEIETLDTAFHQAVSTASAIQEKYLSITGEEDLGRLTQILNDLKTNQSIPQSAKQEIVINLLDRIKSRFRNTEPDTATLTLLQNLAIYSKRIEWEMQGENRIVDFTIKSLVKATDTDGRLDRLKELGPYIRARIKDRKLQDVSGKLFLYLSEFYTQLSRRETKLGVKHRNSGDDLDAEFDLDFRDGALPEFGKEEEEFLSNLAQNDNPKDVASKIETIPVEKKADIVAFMGFDPRFDKHFEEIVAFLNNEDLGKLIGMIIKKTRDIEKVQGKNASEAYITDLVRRLVLRLGEKSIIVAKVKSIFACLKKAHTESTGRLEELRQRLLGKNPLEQIQILKDASEDPDYAPVFGAIRNLERLTVEKYFDEIFNSLPLETQEVIAQSLLSDLAALKQYYPYLIKRLEEKLGQVTVLLRNRKYTPESVDKELENRICDYADATAKQSSHAAENANANESNRKLDQLRELELEIDALPSLNEQIATIRFWVGYKYYEDQPHINQFLINKLDFLEQAKAREGGLLRDLFDQIDKLELIKDKINFLEEKMNDPVYAHLRSIMQTLIDNIGQGISLVPDQISEEWILNQLKGIPEISRKIEWLKIRQNLSPFHEFSGLLNHYVTRYEEGRNEEIAEKLEDKIFRQKAPRDTAGGKTTIYKNIIALTRAVLADKDKVARRKLIKEQERLLPLDQGDRFGTQRKILYYLVNTDTDDTPSLRLKALADKVLLSFDEKRDYLKLLKLSRFTSGGKEFSFRNELGITDNDIAYYATYILGMGRPSQAARIRFIENFKNDAFELPPITLTDKQGGLHTVSYKEFFSINPPLILKVIEDLRKCTPEKKIRQNSIAPVNTNVRMTNENKRSKTLYRDGNDTQDDSGKDDPLQDENSGQETGISDNPEDSRMTDETADGLNTGSGDANEYGNKEPDERILSNIRILSGSVAKKSRDKIKENNLPVDKTSSEDNELSQNDDLHVNAEDSDAKDTGDNNMDGSVNKEPDERVLSNIRILSESVAKKNRDNKKDNSVSIKNASVKTDVSTEDNASVVDDASSDDVSSDDVSSDDATIDESSSVDDSSADDGTEKNYPPDKAVHESPDTSALKKKQGENKIADNAAIDEAGDETTDKIPGNKMKQGDQRDSLYEKHKLAINAQVLKQLRERGMDRSKASAQNMKAGTEKIVSAEKTPFSKRIAGLFEDLAKCFPDAVPDLINHTIIPIFVEKNNAAGRDIFGAVNQNIFIPVLHNGANVNIDNILDSIESFLGETGVFRESRKIIHRISDALRKCRTNEIDLEVTQRLAGETTPILGTPILGTPILGTPILGTTETAKADPKDLLQILKTMVKIEEPDQFFRILNEHYIYPFKDNPDHEGVLKKLQAVRNILNTDKSINWDKVKDILGNEEAAIIRQLKTKYGSIHDRITDLPDERVKAENRETESGRTGNDRTLIPGALEHLLAGMPSFLDPHSLIMKTAAKDDALQKQYGSGQDKARQYIIDTLQNSGKIFSFDRKHFIGYGKLAPFLYDRKNKGYNRPEMTRQLLVFLEKFPSDKLKAEFLGLEEKELKHFMNTIHAPMKQTHSPANSEKKTETDKKQTENAHDEHSLDNQTNDTHAHDTQKHDSSAAAQTNRTEKKTTQRTSIQHTNERRITQRRQTTDHYPKVKEQRKDDRRKITQEKKHEVKQANPVQKKKTQAPQKQLTAKQESIVREAHKLINDKLIELIKSYNTRENLEMLHKMYLSTHADKKYRLNLINRPRHPAIYDVLKDDEAVWNHITLDMHKIMGLYEKKLKKLRK